jgi:hypothetical protein
VADQNHKIATDGGRVEAFLADPAVKDAIERTEVKYFAEFKAADTDSKRTSVWAKLKALDDVRLELKVTVDRGAVAKQELERTKRTPHKAER